MSYDRQLFLKGKQIDVTTTTAVTEWQFSYGTRLVGIKIFLEGSWVWGDVVTFTVHDPVTDAEIGRFAEDCYFTSGMKNIFVKTANEGTKIPANAKYRMSSAFVDSNGRKAAVWLLIRK